MEGSDREEEDFNSKEFDYPLTPSNGTRRSALKKPGKGRSSYKSSMMLKVTFQEVHLREYGMVLGDNPAVSHGAPVQLDWEPQEIHDPVHIDNYDKARGLWRAKDRRGFLLNAHKRVKILFAAGYTIDEIAKATMEMKELKALRAESLKTQGMMTGAIMALLTGAAETTGQTVRAVTIIPNAIAGAGKVFVTGTSTVIMGAGAGMMGMTDKVVKGTTTAMQKGSTALTDTALKGIEGTSKVILGTGNLMVKGTTGVVRGTGKVVAGTGKVGIDVVRGTGKLGVDVVKGTGKLGVDVMKGTGKVGRDVVVGTGQFGRDVVVGTGQFGRDVVLGTGKVGVDVVKGTGKLGVDVVKGTGKLGRDVVKGTGKVGRDVVKGSSTLMLGSIKGTQHVMMGSTKAMVKGTGVLFTGTANAMKTSTRRISRMVNLDSSAHGSDNGMDSSDRTSNRGKFFNSFATNKPRISMPLVSKTAAKPEGLHRQRSLDSANDKAVEVAPPIQVTDELLEMQEFLTQLEGVDKHVVDDMVLDAAVKKVESEFNAEPDFNAEAKSVVGVEPLPESVARKVPDLLPSPAVSEPGTKTRGFSTIPAASPAMSEPGAAKNRSFSVLEGESPSVLENGIYSNDVPTGLQESDEEHEKDNPNDTVVDTTDNGSESSFHTTEEG